MRRAVLLPLTLVLPALGLLGAAPAHAATNTICVNIVDPACSGAPLTTIVQGLQAATNDNQDSVVLIGPGTYAEAPLSLNGTVSPLTVRGAGASTVITAATNVTAYVSVQGATVEDLKVDMVGGATSTSDQAIGISQGAVLDGVVVDGQAGGGDPATDNVSGVVVGGTSGPPNAVRDTQVLLPEADTNSRAVRGEGPVAVTDSTLVGGQGAQLFPAPGLTSTLSRVSIRASYVGVNVESGLVAVDDSVIDLGAGNGTGLMALNDNASTVAKSLTADHVTVVRGGNNSKGALVRASNPTVQQVSTITLSNSIVRTGGTDLIAQAGNGLGAGLLSTATLAVEYTDFATKNQVLTANGAGGVVEGAGNINAAPAFADAAGGNFRLTPGSRGVDEGDPDPLGPATDRDGSPRVVDGDGAAGARRDMGAYELGDVTAPDTQITSGPAGPTNDTTPTFGLASEPGATFECRVDGGAWAPCTDPFTTAPLTDGPHTVEARARDAVLNTDATPASRSFTVDTVAPDTQLSSGPSGPTADNTPTFSFGSEAGATFECRVDAAAYAACASPFTTAGLADGAHTFSVRAKDAAGNLDATPATRAFTVDTVAPETTLTKKVPRRTTKAKVKLLFSSETGATFECQVDAKAWVPCTSPFKVRLAVGKHRVLVRAEDALGNVDATPLKIKVKRVPRR